MLVAPPGAGKTTRVPLVLAEEEWATGRRILVLEPRRIAARAAAERMAKTRGERVGDTVGLRVRFGSKISARTRIEIVTEGVFTRLVLDDPMLEGIAAVLFDEFHERSLDGDLGLALARDAQQGLREDLRLLVMSATIDGARVAALLGDAPVIASEGRAFPVETRYLGRDAAADRAAGRRRRRARDARGSGLGAGVSARRRGNPPHPDAARRPARSRDRCRRALRRAHRRRAGPRHRPRPARPAQDRARDLDRGNLDHHRGRAHRRSTRGLARVPRYEPDVGVTRLETVRVARAAADQRRGRAGRTEPGVCYRLWDEPQTASLEAYARPEILSADLSGFVLDLAAWGSKPEQLAFLDPPPRPALTEAQNLLAELGAIDGDGRITDEGQRLRRLPLPPRLARMVVDAAAVGAGLQAAEIAALIGERGLGGDDVDLTRRLEAFRRDRSPRARDARAMAARWAEQAKIPSPLVGEGREGGGAEGLQR